MKKTLTDRGLKALKPAAPGKRYALMDAVVPGFGVAVTDQGHRSFILIARYPDPTQPNGRSRNPTRRALGEYGALSLEKAREKARDWLEMIRRGIDPKADAEERKLEALRQQENSFGAVCEEYIKRHVAKTRKAAVVTRDLRREFISRWGARPITSITRYDVVAVIDAAVDRGAPYQAHNELGYVRGLFNWAINRGTYGLETSPCDRLRPKALIGAKAVRTRTLTDDEWRAFWTASGNLGYPFAQLFRLLALTGQRKSEVSDSVWPEFDETKELWTIPPERMKADHPHLVPLTVETMKVLGELPRFRTGEHLFSSTFGVKPVSGFSTAKRRIDRLMLAELRKMAAARGDDPAKVTLGDWCIHDLRRSVRTSLSALRVPDNVSELVIAHARPGLHRVYDQHAYLDEKREALTLWAGRLSSIIEQASANVIQLRSAGA